MTYLGMPTAPRGVGQLRQHEPFPAAAANALRDGQLQRNLGHATSVIRAKRAAVVAEVSDWAELRAPGRADPQAARSARCLDQLARPAAAASAEVP